MFFAKSCVAKKFFAGIFPKIIARIIFGKDFITKRRLTQKLFAGSVKIIAKIVLGKLFFDRRCVTQKLFAGSLARIITMIVN